jgi:hypothetical protein
MPARSPSAYAAAAPAGQLDHPLCAAIHPDTTHLKPVHNGGSRHRLGPSASIAEIEQSIINDAVNIASQAQQLPGDPHLPDCIDLGNNDSVPTTTTAIRPQIRMSTGDQRARLARSAGEAGDAAGARDQFAALLPVFVQVRGPEHPSTENTRASLDRWTRRSGQQQAGSSPGAD